MKCPTAPDSARGRNTDLACAQIDADKQNADLPTGGRPAEDAGQYGKMRSGVHWTATIALPVLLITAVIALTWIFPHAPKPNPDAGLEPELPGSGTIVKVEVTRIPVPQAFLDLARSPQTLRGVNSHEDLCRYLQARRLERAWYAMYWRALQVNGRTTNLAAFSRPFESGDRFREFLNVLAAAGTPRDPAADYSTARIDIIPEELLSADPREAMARLIAPRRAADPKSPQAK